LKRSDPVRDIRVFSSLLIACLTVAAPANAANAEAFALNKKGIELAKAGKISEAIAEIKKAVQIDPNNADYHNNLSSLYTALKKPAKAEQEAQLAVKARPSEARSNLNLGRLALANKDYSVAEKAFRTVLKTQPKNADALIGLAGVLRWQKKLDEAEKQATAAVQTTQGCGNPEAHLLLAGILKDNHKLKEAAHEYQTVLNLKPDHPDAATIQDQINFLKSKTEPIHKQ
jgi:tetratricopeptide (TPR) repeat protein